MGSFLAVVSLGLVILLADVMHVSLQGAKFDASCNTVTASWLYCKSELIHALGVLGGRIFLITWPLRFGIPSPPKKNPQKTGHSDTHSRHTAMQRWQLFGVCL